MAHSSDYTAFELAVFNNQIESVKLLLELNADLTPSTENFNKDALCYAIQNQNSKMLELLLPYRDYYNLGHALGTAIETHNCEALRTLLQIGADPNYGYGVTSLLGKAVEEYNWDALNLLLEYHADVNANVSFTPLILSIQYGFADIASYLIENGALINISEQNPSAPENIPVIAAIRYGQLDILKILVENGAQINNINYYGKSVLEYAKDCGSENIYHYINEKSK